MLWFAKATPMKNRHLLVNYHLRPGGVTTVVREQARILTELGLTVVIVSGEAPPTGTEPWPVPVRVIPELGYRSHPLPPSALESVVRQLGDLAGPQGILHFHNPTLGKNPSWMALVNQLASDGQAMLLQIHDFGEDQRWKPGSEPMDHSRYYPCGGRIRWIVLHPDDRAILLAAGLPEDEVAVLPNAVSAPAYGSLPRALAGKFRVVYPARGIRRKNLGEFLLLAALAPSSWEFRTTLPPIGEAQERSFNRWRRWAEKLGVSALLGAGPGEFRPDLVVSTSVREGFGYSFAEPWLADIPATGRHPGRWLVGNDGLPLPHPPGLYQSVRIPTRWIREAVWRGLLGEAVPDAAIRAVIARRLREETIDFADLPECEQRQVLRRVMENRAADGAEIAFQLVDDRWLSPLEWFTEATSASPVFAKSMNESIRDAFAPERLGEKLRDIATSARLSSDGLRGHADASMVPRAFSGPESFRFVRLPPP